MTYNNMVNTAEMLRDLVHGDEAVRRRDDFALQEKETIAEALKVIQNNSKISDKEKAYIMANMWRVVYLRKPPSMEDFLKPEWLGGLADEIYPYIKDTLLEFWNPAREYRHLVLYPMIGFGKSFASVLSSLFITTHMSLMRDAKAFFGLSQATVLVQVLISFSKMKASELLLEPFINILEGCEMFEKVRTKDAMARKERDFSNGDIGRIYWTTAVPTSALGFSNNVNYKLASQPSQLLGATIVSGVMSELAFFSDSGFGQEHIYRVMDDLKKRIYSRIENSYFGRTIIDSSPNDLENVIDDYIVNDAPKNPKNFIVRGSQWDWQPWKYDDIDNRFPVFIGSENKPPRILLDEEIAKFDTKEILYVPVQIKPLFEENVPKTLKDYGGVPTGGVDKLLPDKQKIEDIFIKGMKNIYKHIYVPADKDTPHMMWQILRDEYFVPTGGGKYQFHYQPTLPRYIHIDQAVSGDIAGIGIVHPEWTEDGGIMYVCDLSIAIKPTKKRINLEAIRDFIVDLRDMGTMYLEAISFDQFQSESTKQHLKRKEFDIHNISVDRNTGEYLDMISLINQGRLKMGRNIYVKNNLKSLKETERKGTGSKKIDHEIGAVPKEGGEDWKTSWIGYYAKDVTDGICGAIALAKLVGATPQIMWDSLQFVEDGGLDVDHSIEKYLERIYDHKTVRDLV